MMFPIKTTLSLVVVCLVLCSFQVAAQTPIDLNIEWVDCPLYTDPPFLIYPTPNKEKQQGDVHHDVESESDFDLSSIIDQPSLTDRIQAAVENAARNPLGIHTSLPHAKSNVMDTTPSPPAKCAYVKVPVFYEDSIPARPAGVEKEYIRIFVKMIEGSGPLAERKNVCIFFFSFFFRLLFLSTLFTLFFFLFFSSSYVSLHLLISLVRIFLHSLYPLTPFSSPYHPPY